jgi:hypothetical protein
MSMNTMSRRALFGAGAITLLGPAISGLGGRAAAATPTFIGHPAVKTAMQQRWSGIFNVADMGDVQTLLLLINGEATEVHARRGSSYLAKQPGAVSPRTVTPAQYEQLLAFTGGVDHPVTAGRTSAFAALLNAPTGAPTAACPADFAAMKPIQQQAIRNRLSQPQYQKYAPCFGPLTDNRGWLRELFGGDAEAADAELVFLRISLDGFFDNWNVTYDQRGGYFGFKLFGITAVWDLHSIGG